MALFELINDDLKICLDKLVQDVFLFVLVAEGPLRVVKLVLALSVAYVLVFELNSALGMGCLNGRGLVVEDYVLDLVFKEGPEFPVAHLFDIVSDYLVLDGLKRCTIC
jgi:hypothetical protein